MVLLGLQYHIKSNAYDFSGDELAQSLAISTVPLTLITTEERCVNDLKEQTPCRQLQNVQKGDILITKSSFTLLYRHGHIALVVDAEQGLVIEALGYGTYSTLAELDKWNYYPTVQVLRLKDTNPELQDQLTIHATEHYLDIPYSILTTGTTTDRTHCSALIWKIFNDFGYDLNPRNSLVVRPQDFMESPYLERIESYGFGLEQMW